MGTSTSSTGPGPSTPMVPSGPNYPKPGGSTTTGTGVGTNPQGIESPERRLQNARANFTKFVSSGGTNPNVMRQAIGDYVRDGLGGGGNATIRMERSVTAACRILALFRKVRCVTYGALIQELNLLEAEVPSIIDLFVAIGDVLIYDGGTLDEAIARNAWLEAAVDMLDEENWPNTVKNWHECLSVGQVKTVFVVFISHTIYGMLCKEVGTKLFEYAPREQSIKCTQEKIYAYIREVVEGAFVIELDQLLVWSDADIWKAINQVYEVAWNNFADRGASI